MQQVTSIDPVTGAVVAQNAYNAEFAGRAAFFHVDDASRRVTGDRTEFLGRNGTVTQPAAMTRSTLSGRVGGALDPCAAMTGSFDCWIRRSTPPRSIPGTSRDTSRV